jgi:hypothetical protein
MLIVALILGIYLEQVLAMLEEQHSNGSTRERAMYCECDA